MRDLLHGNTTASDQDRALDAVSAGTPLTPATATPSPRRLARPGAPRRRWSGLAALAAVLAVALLATALFASHIRGVGPGATASPTPDWTGRGSQTTLASIAMVSATEGWAVGSAFPANGTNGNQARVLMMHYQDGVWSSMRLGIAGQINSISMVSASDGWAVGNHGLILHYDGTVWRQVASPTHDDLSQVQMLSATDGWAVGGSLATNSLYHYDGRAWSVQPMPTITLNDGVPHPISITALAMLSPSDGWALGTAATAGLGTPIVSTNPSARAPSTSFLLRYHHGTWSVALTLASTSPLDIALQSISMTTMDDGWVAGSIAAQPAEQPISQSLVLLHYTDGHLQQVADPLAGTTYHISGFLQLSMRAADDGWITASQGASAIAPVALHYDGTRWSVVALPAVAHSATWYLTNLTYSPAGDLWAVGARLSDATTGVLDGHGGFTPTITPLILHEQQGVWSVVMS